MGKTEKNNFQLQRNIKRYNIFLIMLFLTLFSCSNELNDTVYTYNSTEYNNKLKDFKISLEKASNVASRLYFENNPKSTEFNFTLDIILDNYYIFCDSNRLYNLKTGDYFLKGIWVNGKTGEAIYKNTKEYVKIVLDIPSSNLSSYSGTVKKTE